MAKTIEKVKERVTLQTIADQLGVSKTTVSNAYSRPDQLAPELRTKILWTAKELGYCGPSPAARTLRLGRSGAIGFLTAATLSYTVTDPAAVQIIQGVAEVLDERGLNMLTLPSPHDAEAGIEGVRNALVDGFLVFCVPASDGRLQEILNRQSPVVVVDEPRVEGTAFVGIDDRAGGRKIVEHLLTLGHRRFGVLSLALAYDGKSGIADLDRQATTKRSIPRDRLAGYRDAIEAAGLDWASVPVYECRDISRQAGESGGAELLARDEPPTAIVACADLLALGALQAALQRGLNVPGDLSVGGFDDIPEARHGYPPLTTIRQPLREKGHAAARYVVDGWQSDQPPSLVLPTELVVRGSTGPAPVRSHR